MSIQSSEEYEERGRRLLQSERAREALEVFEEGARRFPGDADLMMGTAMALLRLGESVQASEMLEGLCRTHARSAETLQALAESYLARGLTAQALDAAKQSAEGPDGDARQAYRLGRMFYGRQRYHEALPFYERGAKLDPEWGEAWFGLGACYWALKQSASAEAALRRAVELEPKDWQARQFLGCALCDMGRKTEARAVLESVPLDAPWQKPALERLVALAWWPSDPERGKQMEELWRKVMGAQAPSGALCLLEEVSRRFES